MTKEDLSVDGWWVVVRVIFSGGGELDSRALAGCQEGMVNFINII